MHEQRNRLEVALNVVGELAVQEGVDDVSAERSEQQRVTVIRRLRHITGADAAARARAIFHDERYVEFRLHVLLQDARK